MPDELDPLRQAAKGLLYPSESDEPFEVIASNQVPALQGAQEQSLADFFAELESSDDGPRFRQLHQAIEQTLSNPKVFRSGEIEIDIYILGHTKSGQLAGLHTRSIET